MVILPHRRKLFRAVAVGSPPAESDPYINNTVLLLHLNGTNGGTTFIDRSPVPKAMLVYGNAQTSTAQSKFGGSSGMFDGSGAMVSTAYRPDLDFLTGDWTIEFFARWSSIAGYQTVFDHGYLSTGGLAIQSGNGTGKWIVYTSGTVRATETSSTPSLDTWYHYKFTQIGTTITIYRDGVAAGSGANSISLANTNGLSIGAKYGDATYGFNGYLAEYRVTKGIARSATVPTAALPEAAGDDLIRTPSYLSTLGSGERARIMDVDTNVGLGYVHWVALLNGAVDNSTYFLGGAVAGQYIIFDFWQPRLLTEARLYESSSTSQGVWKWQASTDKVVWTDIGGSFTMSNALQTELNSNTTAYRYYRLLGISGNTSGAPWAQEFVFKIDEGYTTGSGSTSYYNSGGMGNRTGIVTGSTNVSISGGIGALLNGTFGSDCYIPTQTITTSMYMRFDFGSAKVIDQAKLWQLTVATGQGVWQWQGSNDASSWTDIGGSFTLGIPISMNTLNSNTTAYRYYQMLGVSGSTNGGPYVYEFEFRISQ